MGRYGGNTKRRAALERDDKDKLRANVLDDSNPIDMQEHASHQFYKATQVTRWIST
jgi:hypothetical protein